MTSTEISLQQCSPDFQYQVQQHRKRSERVLDWSIAALTLTCAAVVTIQPLNNAARNAIAFLQTTKQQVEPAAKLADPKATPGEKLGAIDKLISPDFKQSPKLGEKVAGYEVTSLFGPRSSPCPGCSSFHRGVDLATPIGTVVYAIGSPGTTVKVECKQDSGGGGLYAVQTSPEFPNLSFESLHLSNCAEGVQPAGSVIARSGNSGVGTGAHLHFQVRKQGQLYDYEKFWLFRAVQGSPPASLLQGKPAIPDGTAKPNAADPAASVVSIYAGREMGTAVSFGNRRLVTCAHVVDRAVAGKVTVKLPNGESASATVKQQSNNFDLALLELDRDLPAIALATELPKPGDKATAIGNRFGKHQTKTEGTVLSAEPNRPGSVLDLWLASVELGHSRQGRATVHRSRTLPAPSKSALVCSTLATLAGQL